MDPYSSPDNTLGRDLGIYWITTLFKSLGVVRKFRHAFRGRGVEEFVTVQTQKFCLFGKFVKRGGGG